MDSPLPVGQKEGGREGELSGPKAIWQDMRVEGSGSVVEGIDLGACVWRPSGAWWLVRSVVDGKERGGW